MWGLDENGHFKSDEELHNKWFNIDFITSYFSNKTASTSTGSVAQRVLSDLTNVHLSLKAEQDAGEELPPKAKGKRLLFLFQRDLLDGVSGKILESKSNRDNISSKQVSVEAKVLGWTFLALLNLGMLGYVLLFAINQSVHRQGAWALSFLLWLVVEILFVSSCVVLFTHVVVPSFIMKDVNKIKLKLVESVRAFNASVKNKKRRKINIVALVKTRKKRRTMITLPSVLPTSSFCPHDSLRSGQA